MRLAAALVACLAAAVAHADEMGVLRKQSEATFAAVPVMPSCISVAVESGDPSKGPSIILFKGKAGCTIPWHWHTPSETVMMVSGTAKVQMKGDDANSGVLGPGGFAMMPSKHVHRFTCNTACSAFVSADGAVDIHYVDAGGAEITPEVALAKKRKKK
jgi:quercetin dioxygenase-like cupin family protein